MKKNAIRITAFLLSLFTVFAVAFSAPLKVKAANGEKIPIIYIHGQATSLVKKNDDGSVTEIWPLVLEENQISNYINENLDMFLHCFLTQDWTEFSDTLAEIMSDIFGELALDENAQPVNGSYSPFGRSDWDILNNYTYNIHGLDALNFFYDWRMSPYDIIGDLKTYVDRVLAVTGATEYAFCARCEGAEVALTYYDYYQDDRLTDIILYSSAAKGVSIIGEAFSGKNLKVDPDGLERFLYDFDFDLELPITETFTLTDELLKKILTELNNVYGIDLAAWSINNVYEQIYPELVPKLIRDNFSSFPGFWCMMEEKYYDEARKFMFDGKEEEYSVFLDKIDTYHDNIMVRLDEIIDDALNDGIEVSNIVKTGIQPIPCVKNSDFNSDMLCSVELASFGATCTKFGEKFDKTYLTKALENNTLKYISVERNIDASTCPIPNTTWFVKALNHFDFVPCLDPLIYAIAYNDGFDIYTDKNFPQYMFYDKDTGTVLPLNPDLKTGIDEYYSATNTFARKFKPVLYLAYRFVTLAIKVFMPKAKVSSK